MKMKDKQNYQHGTINRINIINTSKQFSKKTVKQAIQDIGYELIDVEDFIKFLKRKEFQSCITLHVALKFLIKSSDMVKKDLFNNINAPMAIIFNDWLEELLRLMKDRRKDAIQKTQTRRMGGISKDRPEERCVLLIVNLILSFESFIKVARHLNNLKLSNDLDFFEIINKIHKIARDREIETLVNKCMEAKEFIKKVSNSAVGTPAQKRYKSMAEAEEAGGGGNAIDLTDSNRQSSSVTQSFSSSFSFLSYNKNNTGDPLVAADLSSSFLTSLKQKEEQLSIWLKEKEEQRKKNKLKTQKKVEEIKQRLEMLEREIEIFNQSVTLGKRRGRGRGRGRALTQPAWMTRSVGSRNKDSNTSIIVPSSSVSFKKENNRKRPFDSLSSKSSASNNNDCIIQ